MDGKGNAVKVAGISTLVMLFFAGRSYEDNVAPFMHDEVLNASRVCGDGSFIGGCADCSECATYEYVASGGCNFFKDTACQFCEPIENCQRENIECTIDTDQICNTCDCTDPLDQYGDIEKGKFVMFNYQAKPEYTGVNLAAATFSCYWDDDCKPCSKCAYDEWEEAPCSQHADTVCAKCTQCEADEWTSTECNYHADTVCSACDYCLLGDFTKEQCVTGHPHGAGQDVVCEGCKECKEEEWVSKVCASDHDDADGNTQCSACSACEEGGSPTDGDKGGEFINGECSPGEAAMEMGSDTVCEGCSPHPGEGYWEFSTCSPTDGQDGVFDTCSVCTQEQWEVSQCTLEADAVCQTCTPINHCPSLNTACVTPDQENCECTGMGEPAECEAGHACEPNYLGNACQYMQTFAACGNLSYRELTARKAGFEGNGTEEFIDWCREMCTAYPDCLAFEVLDGGADTTASGENVLGGPTDVCHLKNIVTAPTEDADPARDCYSHLHRQSEDDIRAALGMDPFVPPTGILAPTAAETADEIEEVTEEIAATVAEERRRASEAEIGKLQDEIAHIEQRRRAAEVGHHHHSVQRD